MKRFTMVLVVLVSAWFVGCYPPQPPPMTDEPAQEDMPGQTQPLEMEQNADPVPAR